MKITIFGDSWGCGEWVNGTNTHRGLEHFLIKNGYEVNNLSQPGSGVRMIYDRMALYAKYDYHLDKPDFIFVFFTDMARDIWYQENDQYWPELKDFKFYVKRNRNSKRRWLEEYNTLGLPLHFIGALTKVTHKDIAGLENIKIAVPSFQELFIENYTQYEINFAQQLWSLPHNIDKDLLNEIWDQQKIWSYAQEHPWMPDRVHPDRNAHKVLYRYLKKKVLNTQ